MSTKKSQKINPLAKPNGSQASTPNRAGAGNIDESSNPATNAAGNQNPLQMNPQQQQMANGMPMMNNVNFNPNFKNNAAGVPGAMQNNGNLHPQQLAAFQAQAHFANLQQDPSRNNPQYQQYLQQLQQQNQMFLQMQQNQQQQQQHQQLHQQHPQAPAQGFQGQIPQQVPPHFQQAGQNQDGNPQHPSQAFPHPQSQQPTPLQQHQQQPQTQAQAQQAARPGQIPTPQQTHSTQTQPTPQQQHPQIPQQQPNAQQTVGPKPDQPKLSRMPSTAQASQLPRQPQMNTGSMMMNRTPQAGAMGSIPGAANTNLPQNMVPGGVAGANMPQASAQGAAQAAQAAQSGMNNMQNPNALSSMNPSMMNVINFRRQMSNLATLKFLDFCELVGVRTDSTKNILYWRKIITDYFSEIGVLRYSVKSGVDSRQFEFSVPIIPRFFFSIIQSGVTRMEIQPGLLRTQVLANGTTYLESSRCCFTHYYADGSYVNIHGNIRGILNQNLKLDWLDFQTHVFIPGVEWPSLEKLLSDEQKVKDIFQNQENKADNAEAKRLQLLTKFRSNYKVFHSMSNFGLQESVMRVMQVSDVMAHLKSLMLFSITSDDPSGPLNSLDAFVSQSMANTTDKDGTRNSFSKDQEKESPMKMAQSPMTKSGKAPSLDLSQSTLTKRRRKSTVDNGLSPKSTADSPKATPGGNVGKGNKKAKR